MRYFLATLILCALALEGWSGPAHAQSIGCPSCSPYPVKVGMASHHHVAHHAVRHDNRSASRPSHGGGLTRARLADGQVIVVAAAYANRFVGFLNALFHREGRLPFVGCYSPTGHIRNSLHHWGGACDVGQRARNVAWRPMYHIGELAAEFGLTDGCTFKHPGPDCGHLDVSGLIRRRYAAR